MNENRGKETSGRPPIDRRDSEHEIEDAPLAADEAGEERAHAFTPEPNTALVLVPVPPRGIRTGRVSRRTVDAALPPLHAPNDRLEEAAGLAQAINLDVRSALLVPIAALKPATLFGSGKVEELKRQIAELRVAVVIVDFAVTPVQQRNLEKAWSTKVIDRTGLILEIFGERARTREGRLQVEHAHLTYQKSRLVRSWTHLERQRGGGGFLGGPGESQLELDRRQIQDRIDAIRRELDEVIRTRTLHRAGRERVPYPVVAIVGYTNAGKSTLFNRLTGASVLAKDQVFATLDPTMREVKLKSGRRIILSDTVGFISDLPTMLVAAFKATLEEVTGADVILHVRDISHPYSEAQSADVRHILAELGVEAGDGGTPVIEVWNKLDRLPGPARDEALNQARRLEPAPIPVSALSGEGLENLLKAIDAGLGTGDEEVSVTVPAAEGRLANWLHEHAEILERRSQDDGAQVFRLRINKPGLARLAERARRAGATIERPSRSSRGRAN